MKSLAWNVLEGMLQLRKFLITEASISYPCHHHPNGVHFLYSKWQWRACSTEAEANHMVL